MGCQLNENDSEKISGMLERMGCQFFCKKWCSKCHPYWTGNLKRETTGVRVDKFKKKYGLQ